MKKLSIVNHEDELNDHLTYLGAQDWLMTVNDEVNCHSALNKLCESDLKLVYALFVEGCSQVEVASVMGVSQQSVYKRWKRIRKNLLK